MTASAALALALTLVVAVLDWIAVGMGNRRLEYIAKPLTMVALLGVALSLDPASSTQRSFVVVAILLSLAGDVFLMLPGERWFLPGLVAFLGGHLAYIGGFAARGIAGPGAVVGLVVVAVALALVGVRVVRGVGERDPAMRAPVMAYMGVISAMVVCAFGVGGVLTPAGAVLFFASDALIAWNRFITEHRYGRLAIITTYHVGQVLLVLSLI